ncbi:hypothetical protein V6259_12775 [Marinomonas sp. TI.3.20]|uniref:hypothetical protein n=1 Tax=Marinomonas sp. TI.3.20 TaxID=3121296 RepID=UPI00311E557D
MNESLKQDWQKAKRSLSAAKLPYIRLVAYSKLDNGKCKRLNRFIAPSMDLGLRLAIDNFGKQHKGIFVKQNERARGRSNRTQKNTNI